MAKVTATTLDIFDEAIEPARAHIIRIYEMERGFCARQIICRIELNADGWEISFYRYQEQAQRQRDVLCKIPVEMTHLASRGFEILRSYHEKWLEEPDRPPTPKRRLRD